MGLFSFIAKQFIDVIQWTEEEDGILVYRYPMQDMEIQNGASLVVRDTQFALVVNEGKIADLFGPGTHTLTTQTLPVLTYLKHWDKLFESPFKTDVYYFSARLQIDRKWGTPNPITIRDKDFGMVRMRAFGNYSYRMIDPKKFYQEVSGTRGEYSVDDLDGQLRATVIATMSDLFGQGTTPFLDQAANQLELAQQLQNALQPTFERYGLAMDSFTVENISLPEELQKVLDQRIGMNVVGDMNKFIQYQTGQSIPLAAENPGGLAAIGASIGAGAAMSQSMGGAMGAAFNPNQASGESAAVFAAIEKLHEMKTKGILSDEEFAIKKAELLKKIN